MQVKTERTHIEEQINKSPNMNTFKVPNAQEDSSPVVSDFQL